MNIKKYLVALVPFLSIKGVLAHCPLCTLGAGAAVSGAAYFGVNKVILSLLVGAFAISMGMWFARVIKKRYVPFQKTLIILISFLLTVIPILPMVNVVSPYYLSLIGDYGSVLNKTYMLNLSLIASFFGGFLVMISPNISKKITKLRGRHTNYQTMILTFLLLGIFGLIIQLLI